MKKGIFAWFGLEVGNEARFQAIQAAGFQTVMLEWSDDFPQLGPKEENVERAQRFQLTIENGHLSYKHINELWLDTLAGEVFFLQLKRDIASAGRWGVPVLVIHTSSGKNPPPITELGLNRFGLLIEVAEKSGVKLAFENLRKPEYPFAVLDRYVCANAGFCYDVGHRNYLTPEIDYLEKYGNRLLALHLHDNDGTEDQHLLPFDGTVNWKKEMSAIKNTAYRGSLTLEVKPALVDYPEPVMAASLRADQLIKLFEEA